MQTIKKICILFSLLITSKAILAKNKIELSPDNLILSMSMPGKYTKKISQIYKINDKLVCKTEIDPSFFITKKNEEQIIQKLSDAFILESLKKETLPSCHNKVFLKLKNKEPAVLCIDKENKIAENLTSTLSQDCGRN